jgi:hypothetical protein
MIKLGATAQKLSDVLSSEAKNVILCHELKDKKSKISIGFNVPQQP